MYWWRLLSQRFCLFWHVVQEENRHLSVLDQGLAMKNTLDTMLVIGLAIIVVSIFELIVILEGGSYSTTPFGLSDISIAGQVISGHVLGLSFGISFWLMIFGYGGRKLVSLGMDMLKGKKVTLRRNVKNI
jgi:hypothetical protein